MKLLTHNMLQCHVKGVRNGYPLRIEAQQDGGRFEVEVREAEFSADFLRHILPRLDWAALLEAAKALGEVAVGLPDAPPTDAMMHDDAFLQTFHRILLEVTVVEGELVCPESERRFAVKNAVPNMLLHEVRSSCARWLAHSITLAHSAFPPCAPAFAPGQQRTPWKRRASAILADTCTASAAHRRRRHRQDEV